MKKNIYTTLKTLILALVIGVGTALTFGATWFEPGATPTGNNVDAPINTSMSVQTKSGGLNIISDTDEPELWANILSIFGTTYLAGDVKVGDTFESPATPSNNMMITGKLGINLDATAVVTPPATQTIDVNGQARFFDLSALANPDAEFPAPVCINISGTLTLCPLPGALTAFLTSVTPTVTNQDVFIDVIENNTNDYNCSADVSFTAGSTGGDAPVSFSWRARYNAGAPLSEINGTDASGNGWIALGSGGVTNFDVYTKNPQVYNRDDWSIELTATDDVDTVSVVEQDFDVWSIAECKD